MANRFFNARIWHALGWSQTNVEYMRLNDADTTQVIADLATHVAAADPHPLYTTEAEVLAAIDAHEAEQNPHPVYESRAFFLSR